MTTAILFQIDRSKPAIAVRHDTIDGPVLLINYDGRPFIYRNGSYHEVISVHAEKA